MEECGSIVEADAGVLLRELLEDGELLDLPDELGIKPGGCPPLILEVVGPLRWTLDVGRTGKVKRRARG
jgi:hypothetical protein